MFRKGRTGNIGEEVIIWIIISFQSDWDFPRDESKSDGQVFGNDRSGERTDDCQKQRSEIEKEMDRIVSSLAEDDDEDLKGFLVEPR